MYDIFGKFQHSTTIITEMTVTTAMCAHLQNCNLRYIHFNLMIGFTKGNMKEIPNEVILKLYAER